MPLGEALAAGTSRHAAGKFARDADAQGGDGVCDVAFRPDRRRPVAGMSWECQVLGWVECRVLLGGGPPPVRRSGSRRPRCIGWRGGGSRASRGPRTDEMDKPFRRDLL